MSIHFAAITPHSPLIHKPVGKKASENFDRTHTAFEKLKRELYIAKLDTLFVLSPHGPTTPRAFMLSGHPHVTVDLSAFGDLITDHTFKVDTHVFSNIREAGKQEGVPFMVDSSGTCDYGVSIPLMQLSDVLDHTKIVIIRPSQLNAKAHIDCGYILKGIAMQSNKRIGVIASVDLSHSLSTSSPGGFHKLGSTFDEKVQEIIMHSNTAGLVNLNPQLIKAAQTCAYGPLLMLFGMLSRVKTRPHITAYEAPLGVGHMTAQFKLH